MKDSLQKFTVRIYDSKTIERFENVWRSFERLYTTQNSFVVDLLLRGIESVEKESANIVDMKENGNIFIELKRLTSLLNRFVDVGYEHYKESFVIGKENQTLISRLYHIIFRLAKEKGISIDTYNRGIFDGLPENFEEITENLIKAFNARGNT